MVYFYLFVYFFVKLPSFFCSFFCCQSSALSPSLVIPYCGDPFKCLCVKRETKHIHRVWCCFIKCNERVIRIRIIATLIRWFIQLWIMLMQFIRLFVFRWICKSWFCCKISMNWYQRYEYRPDSSVVMCMRIFFSTRFVRSFSSSFVAYSVFAHSICRLHKYKYIYDKVRAIAFIVLRIDTHISWIQHAMCIALGVFVWRYMRKCDFHMFFSCCWFFLLSLAIPANSVVAWISTNFPLPCASMLL